VADLEREVVPDHNESEVPVLLVEADDMAELRLIDIWKPGASAGIGVKALRRRQSYGGRRA